jgi:type VI secretion system protein ImpE
MLQNQVRAEPSEARHRVFLFQLLSVLGQWDRALTQLNVAGEMDAGNLGMVQVSRQALASEALRVEVFAGAAGEIEKSQEMRAAALDEAPTTSGTLNGKPFEWIADADARIGPNLEAIINGRYFWVPFHHIAEIRIEEPEDLRDLVWVMAELRWQNGGEAVALLPTRYPGSESSADPQLQLARRTEWLDQGDDLYLGLGQRILVTDQDEYSLLEVRNIILAASVSDDGQPVSDG